MAAARQPGPESEPAGVEPLLGGGTDSPEVEAYRERVRGLIEQSVLPLFESAESERRFPRAAAEAVGEAGLFRERWSGEHGDVGRALVFAEELGRALTGGIGVGLLVQSENVIPVLRRFGESDETGRWMEETLDGSAIGCIGASELAGGSDLGAVQTTAEPEDDAWRLRGVKAYSSPAGAADFCLALCRLPEQASFLGPPLAIALVERNGFEARPLETAGCRSLETCRLTIDTLISPGSLIAARGLGLHALVWGLSFERFAGAVFAVGGAETALQLATTRLRRHSQFGGPLFDQQSLRMRVASLGAELMLLRGGLYEMASRWTKVDGDLIRRAAAAKVTAARLCERVLSECAHIFGGAGYLEDETPFPRLIRDARLARLGGGSDEMMLELYAQGLESDDDLYDRLTSIE